jgi:hypothetical protein
MRGSLHRTADSLIINNMIPLAEITSPNYQDCSLPASGSTVKTLRSSRAW